MVDDPVEGGWVRRKKVPKPGNYARLDELLTDLSPDCLEFFEKYRRMYFFDRFIPDQGMEETLDTQFTEQIDLCDMMPEALNGMQFNIWRIILANYCSYV